MTYVDVFADRSGNIVIYDGPGDFIRINKKDYKEIKRWAKRMGWEKRKNKRESDSTGARKHDPTKGSEEDIE